jgi:hypothetical protein
VKLPDACAALYDKSTLSRPKLVSIQCLHNSSS